MMTVQRHTQQLPGAWFYEMGNESTGLTSSPPSDVDMDAFAFGARSAALTSRNITESVEVPSSEHVAEIVGRQGTLSLVAGGWAMAPFPARREEGECLCVLQRARQSVIVFPGALSHMHS
jgi:hypothetical protein